MGRVQKYQQHQQHQQHRHLVSAGSCFTKSIERFSLYKEQEIEKRKVEWVYHAPMLTARSLSKET